MSLDGGYCLHTYDVGVVCLPNTNSTRASQFDVRLVGRQQLHSGRVQIGLAGIWGSVCASQWDNSDASVVCHQLGYGRAAVALGGHEPALGRDVNLPAWMNYVSCRGDEEALQNCSFREGWGVSGGCPEQASVICRE
jgi:hypothetical protein